MSRERLNFWIDAELAEGLKAIKARDGVSEAEQIRRGIRMYLKSKKLSVAARKGAKLKPSR